MAGFYNSTGLIDTTGNISLRLTGPTGTVFLANDTTLSFTTTGTYTLTAICGGLSDNATINVSSSGCPYQNIQVRVQPNVQTAWTQTLVIVAGQSFRVGGFFNATGQLAPNGIALFLSGPSGPLPAPANGSFVIAPSPGVYALTGRCGSLQESAAVIAQ